MKVKLFLILLFLIFIGGCSGNKLNENLELKEKSEIQGLNQIQVLGAGIGDKPLDFSVVSWDGNPIVLNRLLNEGKPIIVYFMATWCPYCAEDYKALSKIYREYENNIIFVSIDLDLSENMFDLQEYRKKYPQLQKTIFAVGNEKVLRDYSVTKTTTKYAISRNGTVSYRTIGVFDEEQWKILLDRLVGT